MVATVTFSPPSADIAEKTWSSRLFLLRYGSRSIEAEVADDDDDDDDDDSLSGEHMIRHESTSPFM